MERMLRSERQSLDGLQPFLATHTAFERHSHSFGTQPVECDTEQREYDKYRGCLLELIHYSFPRKPSILTASLPPDTVNSPAPILEFPATTSTLSPAGKRVVTTLPGFKDSNSPTRKFGPSRTASTGIKMSRKGPSSEACGMGLWVRRFYG